ncbi:MAG: hypothetical protein JWQ71_1059 [Pedosphaera sp.]|nr:hypothetical protein [Pedosphaera sp.]
MEAYSSMRIICPLNLSTWDSSGMPGCQFEFYLVHFNLKQMFLSVQATGKASKGTIFAGYTMAGDDDAQRILSSGGTGSANRAGRARPIGQLRVGDGFSKGNERNLPPDFVLKIRSSIMKWNRKFCSRAFHVFLNLCAGLL